MKLPSGPGAAKAETPASRGQAVVHDIISCWHSLNVFSLTGMPQVEEERKEAEAIKEKVAKDEAAVATRQEEVMRISWRSNMSRIRYNRGIITGAN